MGNQPIKADEVSQVEDKIDKEEFEAQLETLQWLRTPVSLLLDDGFVQDKYKQLTSKGDGSINSDKQEALQKDYEENNIHHDTLEYELDLARLQLFTEQSIMNRKPPHFSFRSSEKKKQGKGLLSEMALSDRSFESKSLEMHIDRQYHVFNELFRVMTKYIATKQPSPQPVPDSNGIDEPHDHQFILNDNQDGPENMFSTTAFTLQMATLKSLRRKDEILFQKKCEMLIRMLSNFPMLSLSKIRPNSAEQFALMSIYEICSDVLQDPTITTECYNMVCTILLALGIASGKVFCLLRFWKALWDRRKDYPNEKFSLTSTNRKLLECLQTYRHHFDLKSFGENTYIRGYSLKDAPSIPGYETIDEDVDIRGSSFGIGENYVYLCQNNYLIKAGTGSGETIGGRIYAKVSLSTMKGVYPQARLCQALYGRGYDVTHSLQLTCRNQSFISYTESKEDLLLPARVQRKSLFDLSKFSLYIEYSIGQEERGSRTCQIGAQEPIVLPPTGMDLVGNIHIEFAYYGDVQDMTNVLLNTGISMPRGGMDYGILTPEGIGVSSSPSSPTAFNIRSPRANKSNKSNLLLRYQYGKHKVTKEILHGESMLLTPVGLPDDRVDLVCVNDVIYLNIPGLCQKKEFYAIPTSNLVSQHQIPNAQAPSVIQKIHLSHHTASEMHNGTLKLFKDSKQQLLIPPEVCLIENMLLEASCTSTEDGISTVDHAFENGDDDDHTKYWLTKLELKNNYRVNASCMFHSHSRSVSVYRVHLLLPTVDQEIGYPSSWVLEGKDDFCAPWQEIDTYEIDHSSSSEASINIIRKIRESRLQPFRFYQIIFYGEAELHLAVKSLSFYEVLNNHHISTSNSISSVSSHVDLSNSSKKEPYYAYFTEGQYIYFAEEGTSKSLIQVSVFNASTPDAVPVRTFELNLSSSLSGLVEEFHSKFDGNITLYFEQLDSPPEYFTNGDQLGILFYCKDKCLVVKFDAISGDFIESFEASELNDFGALKEDKKICFDLRNNWVWCYLPHAKELYNYRNLGQSAGFREYNDFTNHPSGSDLSTIVSMDRHVLSLLHNFSGPFYPSGKDHPSLQVSTDFDKSLPFSVDLNIEGLILLTDAIATLSDDFIIENECKVNAPQKDTGITLLLTIRILTTNLECLLHSECWDKISDAEEKAQYVTMSAQLLSPLQKLIHLSHDHGKRDIQASVISAALKLFVVGIDLFYPQQNDQVNFVLDLVQKIQINQISKVENTVLNLLLKRLATIDTLASFVTIQDSLAVFEKLCDCAKRMFISTLVINVENEERPDTVLVFETNGKVVKLINSIIKSFLWKTFDRYSSQNMHHLGKFTHILITQCLTLITETIQALDQNDGSEHYIEYAEMLLQKSVLGSTLPFVCTSLSLYMSHSFHVRSLLLTLQKQQAQFVALVQNLGELSEYGLVKEDQKRVVVSSASSKKVGRTIESSHPYENNVHTFTEVIIPGAEKIIIEFDPRSQTETGYDYVTFYHDASETEYWGTERYTGRNRDQNWPGVNRPPLIIPSDHFHLHFHSDSSGVDWGWQFTAHATIPHVTESMNLHWFVQTQQSLVNVLNEMITQQVHGMTLTPVSELEQQVTHVVESDLVKSGYQTGVAELTAFLESVILPQKQDAAAEHVIRVLRQRVAEDQGGIEHINTAVRAVAAAIVHHNVLGMDAYALGTKERSDVSPELLKAWRNAQKMRRWFDLGDAAEGRANDRPSTPRRVRRQPSAFKGASDQSLRILCANVLRRARFLLSLAPVKFGFIPGSRKRWELLAKYGSAVGHLAEMPHHDRLESSTPDLVEKWYHVVNELHAATQLKNLLQYRRSSSVRRAGRQNASITEMVLEFVQSDVEVDEIKVVMQVRNVRAKDRMNGLNLLVETLGACSSSQDHMTKALLLERLAATLRDTITCYAIPTAPQDVHFLSGLSSCQEHFKKGTADAFGKLLLCIQPYLQRLSRRGSVGDMGHSCHSLSGSISSKSKEHLAHDELCMAVLKCCSIDYDIADHYLLHESRILPQLLVLLSPHQSFKVRRTAQAALRHLLSRFVAVSNDHKLLHDHQVLNRERRASSDGQASSSTVCEITSFQKQLLASVRLQMEGILAECNNAKVQKAGKNAVYELRENFPGPTAPHTLMSWEHSFSFWLYLRESKYAYALKAGDYVRRGPNWSKEDEDGGVNSAGTVLRIEKDKCQVRWNETGITNTYIWNPDEKFFEILLLDEGDGGCVFFKGNKNLSLENDTFRAWNYFGIFLSDSGRPRLVIGTDKDEERHVECDEKIHSKCWTHLACTIGYSVVTFYFNGRKVSEHFIDSNHHIEEDYVQYLESNHPMAAFEEVTSQFEELYFPGAKEILIVFDKLSDLSGDADNYVRFYKDATHTTHWGESSYGSQSFPGVRGNKPLIIPSNRVIVYYQAGSSKKTWGFRLKAVANHDLQKKIVQDDKELLDFSDVQPKIGFNKYPIYFGELPMRVYDARAANCCIADFKVHPAPLSEVKFAGQLEIPGAHSAGRPKIFPTDRTAQVLALMHGCCETNIGRSFISSTKTVKNILILAFTARFPATIRCGALRVLVKVLPELSPSLINQQISGLNIDNGSSSVDNGSSSPPTSLIKMMMQYIGSIESVYVPSGLEKQANSASIDIKRLSAQSNFQILDCYVQLLHVLSMKEEWFDELLSFVAHSFQKASTIIEKWIEPSRDKPVWSHAIKDELHRLYASVAFLGGKYSCISPGNKVKCCFDVDGKESVEVGTVIELRRRGEMHVARVVLECDPDHIQDIPLADIALVKGQKVSSSVGTLDQVYEKLSPKHLSMMVPTLTTLLDGKWMDQLHRHDRTTSVPPKLQKEERVQVIESEHPYGNDIDKIYKLDFPGAKEIEIEFDPQSSTESHCDFIRFNKRGQIGHWGEEKYHGDHFAKLEHGPEDQGLKFVIPAGSVDVYFHSDASNVDWGFRLTARATTESETLVPETPPSNLVLALSDIRCRALKLCPKLFQHIKSQHLALCQPLLKPMVRLAIRSCDGRPIKPMSKTQIFESKHPYCNSISEYMTVNFQGAESLHIVFDTESKTENVCDYVVFYKDKSLEERWGEQRYTGRSGGENWPGCGGRPPLVISGDEFTLFWCTDGSNTDWGWKFVVTAEFPSVKPIDSPLEQLNQRLYYIGESMYEEMQTQWCPPQGALYDPQVMPPPAPARSSPCMDVYEDFASNETRLVQLLLNHEIQATNAQHITQHLSNVEEKMSNGSSNRAEWPKEFRVERNEGVMLYTKHRRDSTPLGMIPFGTIIVAIEQYGDWLRTNEFAWCCRREGDQFHLVRAEAIPEEAMMIVLGVDDDEDISSTNHHGGIDFRAFTSASRHAHSPDDSHDLDEEEAPGEELFSPHFILEDLKEQLMRLQSLAWDTLNAATVKWAQRAVYSYVHQTLNESKSTEKWSLADIGSAEDVLSLLVHSIPASLPRNEQMRSKKMTIMSTLMIRLVQHEVQSPQLSITEPSHILPTSIEFCKSCLYYSLRVLPRGRAVVRTIESNHPYDNNMNQCWAVSIPDAKRIKIVFDPKSQTETACDSLSFYKDAAHRVTVGAKEYGGRAGNENWPGCGGRPPLWIDGDYFEAVFRSDASGTDWGFRFKAYGMIVDDDDKTTISEKQQKDRTQQGIKMADSGCWLLETLSKMQSQVVNTCLFSSDLFKVLHQALQQLPQALKLRILDLLASMVSHNVQAFQDLHATMSDPPLEIIKSKMNAQYRIEESSETKSSYLQALVQCCLSMEMALSFGNEGLCTTLTSSDTPSSFEDKLIWGNGRAKHQSLELFHGNQGIRKSPAGSTASATEQEEPVSARANIGYSSGVHSWDVVIQKCHGRVSIGISFDSISTNVELGVDSHSHGWENKVFRSKLRLQDDVQDRLTFGTKVYTGDIIQVQLDLNQGTLSYRRNGAFLGYAIGDSSTGAVIQKKLEGMFYPAITLFYPGDEILLRPSSTQCTPMSASGQPPKQEHWYTESYRAIEMLQDYKEHQRVPKILIEQDLLPQLSKEETQIRESLHPYSQLRHRKSDPSSASAFIKPEEESIHIPSATRLELRFHRQTSIDPNDVIVIRDPAGKMNLTFRSSDFHQDSASRPNTSEEPLTNNDDPQGLELGDAVVRGSDWDYGEQDGGPGFHGIVTGIEHWREKSQSGIRVCWNATQQEYLYRFGYHGYYDIQLDVRQHLTRRGQKTSHSIWIDGDTVLLSIEQQSPSGSTSPVVKDDNEYCGSLFFNQHQALDLNSSFALARCAQDFTLEFWIRPSFTTCNSGEEEEAEVDQCLVVLQDLGEAPGLGLIRRLLLDPCTHQLTYVMGTEDSLDCYATWIPSTILPTNTWSHVALACAGELATLSLDGQIVARETFDLSWRSDLDVEPSAQRTKVRFGHDFTDTYFEGYLGHLCDIQLWDAPLAQSQIRTHARGREDHTPTPVVPTMTNRCLETTNRSGSDFVSVRTNESGAIHDFSKGGKVYYEVKLLSSGMAQLGWAFDHCAPERLTAGIGDCRYSFAVDLDRQLKWYDRPEPYGHSSNREGWKKGDIVGCCLDLASGVMRFTLNGQDLGEAFHRAAHHPPITTIVPDDEDESIRRRMMMIMNMDDEQNDSIHDITRRLISPDNVSSVTSRDSGVMDEEMLDEYLDFVSDPDTHEHVQELVALGFSRTKCRLALAQAHGDLSQAISLLLEQAEEEEEEEEEDENHQDWGINMNILDQEVVPLSPSAPSPLAPDSVTLWTGFGALRPAASIAPQGAQGFEWIFTAKDMTYLPETYQSLDEFCSSSHSGKINMEIYDHGTKAWESIAYRHKVLSCLEPQRLGRWPLRDGLSPRGATLLSTIDSQSQNGGWDDFTLHPMVALDEPHWGYHVSIRPHFSPTDVVLSIPRFASKVRDFHLLFSQFTPSCDRELVKLMNDVAVSRNLSLEHLLQSSWPDLAPKDSSDSSLGIWSKYPKLRASMNSTDSLDAPRAVAARVHMIQKVNQRLASILPFIDFSALGHHHGTFASLLSTSRHIILSRLKSRVCQRLLESSESSNDRPLVDIALSRPLAMKFNTAVDTTLRKTLFAQAFRQLGGVDPQAFRRPDNKGYFVQFLGENAQDAGGPYRETFVHYCAELQSPRLPFLIQTPNGRHNVGTCRDHWILNAHAHADLSDASSSSKCFTFFGQLLGLVLRSGDYIPLQLSTIIWKLLVSTEPDILDLEALDSMAVSSNEKMRTIETLGVTEHLFEDVVCEVFTTISSNDRVLELKPGGADIPVTFRTRVEFAHLVEQVRLHEFDQVAGYVRQGLSSVVPESLLQLLTHDELEFMICGSKEIDVDLLKSCTEYSGCSPTEAHVQFFWQALREFDVNERSDFLKFVWGRARLPNTKEEFPQRFKLQSFNKSPAENYLPVAHTCFFALELPRYPTLELLKAKLRYAIHHCQAMDVDGDAVAANQLGWED